MRDLSLSLSEVLYLIVDIWYICGFVVSIRSPSCYVMYSGTHVSSLFKCESVARGYVLPKIMYSSFITILFLISVFYNVHTQGKRC